MSLAALAATRTLKDGVSDWTKQDSYDEGVAPTANDIVALSRLKAFLTVEGGLIRRLSFFGDFFSTDDPALLAEKLLDCPREEGAILERLENTDVSRFIHGLHAKELALLLAP